MTMRSLTILILMNLYALPLLVSSEVPHEKIREISVVDISGDWETAGDLPRQALILSLQGLANRREANIYLLYPDDYKHPDVKAVLEYYKHRHGVRATTMSSVEALLERYQSSVTSYVIWDPEVLPSLIVAFTVAGIEDALVITEAYVPLAEKSGLKQAADLRGTFRGKKDVEIFRWAYEQYGQRCSKKFLVYLGEWCRGLKNGPGMQPGIADFAIAQKAFCTTLSTRPTDKEEYALADSIMGQMPPLSYIYGWHSYCKDMEEEHITMASRHALIVAEGLATLPNMSFHGNIPVSPDFHFRQKGTYNPHPKIEHKVYLTLIQSDGMGIGSWNRPGRGEIPYGWEANEEYFETAPALLQYYYESATPNDYFIGSLSGPGYFYPKYFPPDKLALALRREDSLMRRMDLHVFGIMDFSEGDHAVGNADLPKRVVDIYYDNLPAADGFLNGYGPANTYDCRNGRPLISYNYYVDIRKPVDEVVEDLRELARINPQRPYFCPVHVREDNDVQRMKEIVSRLGSEFQIVPPREFVIMAGRQPTMTVRYLEEHPDFSGHWKLDGTASKNIFPRTFDLDIDQRGSVITMSTKAIEPRYVHHRELVTTKTLVIGGKGVAGPEELTRRMGYSAGWSDSVVTSAAWKPDGKTLVLTTSLDLQTSQGTFASTSTSEVRLSTDLMTLTITERRSTRHSDEPVTVFVYRRVLP